MKTLKMMLIGLIAFSSVNAQNLQDSVKQDEKEIISAIAAYPADMRNAILNVSQYTPKLIKLERLQSRTSQSFQDLVANKSREDQEKFYEVSRYPVLIKELGSSSIKSDDELKSSLASYPEGTQKIVHEIYPSQASEFRIMNSLLEKSDESMQTITKSLPTEAQVDFKKILTQPDVMNLLTDRIDNVVSLGEAYKENPAEVKRNLDELSTKINEQSEKDLADYKKKVESDPQMQEEMKKSAQQFSDSYSANTEANSNEEEDSANQTQNSSAQANPTAQPLANNNYYVTPDYYNTNPYPYWFGYPYWYARPIWYPRPWYYHTGFYYGAGGNLVVVGMPSGYYSGWFFRRGWNAYPRYYGFCRNYYTAHNTFVNRNVNVYRSFNRNVDNHFTRINNVNNNRVVTNRVQNNARVNNNVTRNINHVNNQNGNSFNRSHYNNFHAQQFHQQSWGGHGRNFGGARGGGGGGRRR
jgi:hypothetical protein